MHRQVARFLKEMEAHSHEVAATVWVLLVSPGDLPAAGDGSVDAALLERLEKKLKPARLELSGQATGLLRASSVKAVEAVTGFDGGNPRSSVIQEGAAVELRAVPSGAGFRVHVRAGFRKVLGVDEFPTRSGTLKIPRLVEAHASEDRHVPEGRPVVLARLGPLPGGSAEVVFVGRFGWRRR